MLLLPKLRFSVHMQSHLLQLLHELSNDSRAHCFYHFWCTLRSPQYPELGYSKKAVMQVSCSVPFEKFRLSEDGEDSEV